MTSPPPATAVVKARLTVVSSAVAGAFSAGVWVTDPATTVPPVTPKTRRKSRWATTLNCSVVEIRNCESLGTVTANVVTGGDLVGQFGAGDGGEPPHTRSHRCRPDRAVCPDDVHVAGHRPHGGLGPVCTADRGDRGTGDGQLGDGHRQLVVHGLQDVVDEHVDGVAELRVVAGNDAVGVEIRLETVEDLVDRRRDLGEIERWSIRFDAGSSSRVSVPGCPSTTDTR